MRFIFPTILILISIGSFMLFTGPAYTQVKTLKAESSQYNQALDNSRELDTERDTLSAKYRTFTPDQLDRLQKLLPDSADNIRLIIDIQSMAQTYGMSISSIKFDTPTGGSSTSAVGPLAATAPVGAGPTTDYNTFSLEFSTTGSYEDFIKFLKDLESSLRLTDVESIDFSSDSQSSSSGKSGYTYTIKLQTYYLKSQTSTGDSLAAPALTTASSGSTAAAASGTPAPSASTTAPALSANPAPAQ